MSFIRFFDAMDVVEIQNLVYRYCWHIDHGDFQALAQMFAHAEVTLPAGLYRNDPAGLEAVFREYVRMYPDKTPRTRHVTTNLIIDAEAVDKAVANSAVMVFQQTDGLPLQPIIGTRNFDRFEKVDGHWRFVARRIEIDLFGNLSAHMRRPLAPSASSP
jgi:hypothetical protein